MRQVNRVKEVLRDRAGDRPTIDGRQLPAFPRPGVLLEQREIPGISAEKVRRVHGLAEVALDGRLNTEVSRAMPPEQALASLRELPGVGAWTVEATLLRGCGIADVVPATDETSRQAARELSEIDRLDDEAWLRLTERWRPFRMWAVVLLRLGWNRIRGAGSYRGARRR